MNRNGVPLLGVVEGRMIYSCDDLFCSVANGIGFDDNISSTSDAINKHATHPSVQKIREVYGKDVPSFHFKCNKLRNIDLNKSAGYDNIPGKLTLIFAHLFGISVGK